MMCCWVPPQNGPSQSTRSSPANAGASAPSMATISSRTSSWSEARKSSGLVSERCIGPAPIEARSCGAFQGKATDRLVASHADGQRRLASPERELATLERTPIAARVGDRVLAHKHLPGLRLRCEPCGRVDRVAERGEVRDLTADRDGADEGDPRMDPDPDVEPRALGRAVAGLAQQALR